MLKKVLFITVFTWLFLGLFLVIDSIFFTQKSPVSIENEFIEKTKHTLTWELNTPLSQEEREIYEKIFKEEKLKLTQQSQEEKKTQTPISVWVDATQTKKIFLSYTPAELKEKLAEAEANINTFTQSDHINSKIYFLWIDLYEKIQEVRGKFKDKSIKLFWVLRLPKNELLSVFVHEFWHYLDLYYLEGTFTWDTSSTFYDISWEETKVLKKWSKQSHFVSGYAMTNKYEDFAETFTFFVLHNKRFYTLAQKDDVLLKKYLFFKDYVFPDEAFSNTDFSTETQPKNYYRDITKIPYNFEKTLQYLTKSL